MDHVTFPSGSIQIAAHLYAPKDFSKDRTYVAIVCVHPAGARNLQRTSRPKQAALSSGQGNVDGDRHYLFASALRSTACLTIKPPFGGFNDSSIGHIAGG